jgi:hypothetical protein
MSESCRAAAYRAKHGASDKPRAVSRLELNQKSLQ